MCLIAENKEKKIALEDIVVYKSGTIGAANHFISTYMHTRYNFDTLYNTELEESDEWSCLDYMDSIYLDKRYDDWNQGKIKELLCIGQGFHSYKNIDRAKTSMWSNESIVECIIPKGAEYYEGVTDLLVSNQIIIKKIIEI